jgi:hypothetical protein
VREGVGLEGDERRREGHEPGKGLWLIRCHVAVQAEVGEQLFQPVPREPVGPAVGEGMGKLVHHEEVEERPEVDVVAVHRPRPGEQVGPGVLQQWDEGPPEGGLRPGHDQVPLPVVRHPVRRAVLRPVVHGQDLEGYVRLEPE